MTYTRLGDLLVSVGLISPEQLEHALEFQKKTKNRLGSELIEEKIITEQQLMSALQKQLGVECVDLSQIQIPPRLAELLPKNIARKYGIVPVKLGGNTLYIAMSDPLNFMAIEEVKTATRKRVVPMIATSANIERAISTLYGNEGAARAIEDMKREIAVGTQSAIQSADNFTASVLGGEEESEFAPTVRLVNSIIERAVEESASDIHIEPEEKELRVRMRIDGVMHSIMPVPKDLQGSVISRLKIMGGMDITERRIPQDGRAAVRSKDRDVDLRMSTLPVIYGEKVVIRLLDKDAQLLSKERLGLMGGDLEKYTDLIQRPSGVVLIVGPTGSGKSSTMYTMIRELNTEQVNLISLEDPVEYNIDGANQVQINEKTGMTFAGGLRAILRQDPDIIAVGEIRDGETAQIAMRAAITGHLVLSTIHTNDALSTIDRLKDIGVEPYLISGAVNGIISQRLVRRICPDCRQEYDPNPEEWMDIGMIDSPVRRVYRGAGCSRCFGTGYRGRIAAFEILTLSHALRLAVNRNASREELEEIIRREGRFVSLAENVQRLVLEGTTTVEEARRITVSAENL
ncbi:GspE/PulE family protein [Oscillibacter sp.]|uniref:GspE/PulE family protein n=1 Tax=Oscillibacter sp. TaxID=1945593 RepID=UPI002897F138|nr:GspE/PulE family protein [Oscillibacter sp.]